MINFKIPEQLDKKAPSTWLASWFGFGFINPAPGTWGTIGAIPFGVVIYALCGAWGLALATIIITIIGFWAADKFDKSMSGHDSKMIVIDEVAGVWIALIPAGLNPLLIIAAFITFRFFDILKPWPISFIDKKVKGAMGVMGDDLLAGVIAALCIIGINQWIN